jgi:hypothetical protein
MPTIGNSGSFAGIRERLTRARSREHFFVGWKSGSPSGNIPKPSSREEMTPLEPLQVFCFNFFD